ncbi:acyl carrier protein [Kitasatospora sp. MAA4]|uniref:phosphopantetheine-binding protein n=1 Tax=Kitasatospora sp. MAA4 TaxID=3035093 RepID=UPI00247D7070|nr:acyl carrier protein [Kitasatospora sp. MAA4]
MLSQALRGSDATLMVADLDWERLTPALTAVRPSPLIGELPEAARVLAAARDEDGRPASPEAAGLVQRLAGLSPAEQERRLLELVRTEIAAVLGHSGIEAVPARRSLKDLGVDSLAAVSLRNRLGAASGLKLSATLVFDHPTPAAIAAHLRDAMVPEEPVVSLDEELDRLAATLLTAAAQDAVRERITLRLQSLLSELNGAGQTADVAAQLEEASDEDIFAFIDSELGTL